jgi:very-short-patch-repair endonuclease
MNDTPDHRLAQFARAQYGLVTRPQAGESKISNRMLQLRVQRGTLQRLSRDVFRVAGTPDSWHQRLLAASLRGGPDCCVSHRAAARLYGFDGFRAEVVEVIHHQRRDYRDSSGVIVHSTSVLDSCDRTSLGPIPVTTPVRTLIDLGAVVRPDRLEEALDSAERDGHVDRFELATRHAQIRQSGRNGVGPLALLLDARDARSATPHSVLERRMLRLLTASGLPTPECQVRVRRADGRVAFLDLAYPEVQLGIELDGHAWHATALQRQRDHERQNQVVVVSDWTVLRFTYADVSSRPEHVAALVRHALFAGASRRSIPA